MYQVPNTSRKNYSKGVDNAPLLQKKKNPTTLKQIHIVAKNIFPARPCSLLCCVNQTWCTLPATVSGCLLLSHVKIPSLVTMVLARTPTVSRAAAGCRDREAGEVSSTSVRLQILSRVESAFLYVCVRKTEEKARVSPLVFFVKNKTQTAKKSIVQMEEKLKISCCEMCRVSTPHLWIYDGQ